METIPQIAPTTASTNLISFDVYRKMEALRKEFQAPQPEIPTPITDAMAEESMRLNQISNYKTDPDFTAFRRLEKRSSLNPIRGGILLKTAFRLVNAHPACQQCLYAFEIDTYGRGCVHECLYCYAKAQLTVHGYWNKPYPVPININEVRKLFYTVFETDKKNKWRTILERRIPLRIGSMSDSFMWMDQKYKVTQELLKLLRFYRYPYTIITRSDLVAHDDYMSLLDPKLAGIQFTISSTNEDLLRKLERGAPSAKRRLLALAKLTSAGFWTTVRLNPFFPIYPDGYFSDQNFKWQAGEIPKFNFSSFEMVDEIADHGVPAILAGFGRFSSYSLNQIAKASGIDLKPFFNRFEVRKSTRDFHYSDKEVIHYYLELQKRCAKRGVEFTTCYIGNGEKHFWDFQGLWSNKSDCCNLKQRIASFKNDSREIPFNDRASIAHSIASQPNSNRLHEPIGTQTPIRNNKPSPRLTPVELGV